MSGHLIDLVFERRAVVSVNGDVDELFSLTVRNVGNTPFSFVANDYWVLFCVTDSDTEILRTFDSAGSGSWLSEQKAHEFVVGTLPNGELAVGAERSFGARLLRPGHADVDDDEIRFDDPLLFGGIENLSTNRVVYRATVIFPQRSSGWKIRAHRASRLTSRAVMWEFSHNRRVRQQYLRASASALAASTLILPYDDIMADLDVLIGRDMCDETVDLSDLLARTRLVDDEFVRHIVTSLELMSRSDRITLRAQMMQMLESMAQMRESVVRSTADSPSRPGSVSASQQLTSQSVGTLRNSNSPNLRKFVGEAIQSHDMSSTMHSGPIQQPLEAFLSYVPADDALALVQASSPMSISDKAMFERRYKCIKCGAIYTFMRESFADNLSEMPKCDADGYFMLPASRNDSAPETRPVDPKRYIGRDGWAMLIAVGDVVHDRKMDANFIDHCDRTLPRRAEALPGIRGDQHASDVSMGKTIDHQLRADGTEFWVRFDESIANTNIPRRAIFGLHPQAEGFVIAVPPIAPYSGDREQRGPAVASLQRATSSARPAEVSHGSRSASEQRETGALIDFAILTAIEVERRAICAVFGLSDEHRIRKDSRVYWRGSLPLKNGGAYELVVAQAPDAANIDAAILTNDLLHHWQPGAALLVGIAASTDPSKVRLGDVVLGSEVYYYERGKETSAGRKPEPKIISADATLWSNVTAVPDWDGTVAIERPDGAEIKPKIHQGVIASGEKVIADAAVRDQIAAGHRKILALEMEGYGFSRAVWQSFAPVRHLDIRGICDDGSEAKNDHWHQYAATAAASFVRHFLLDRPLTPRGR